MSNFLQALGIGTNNQNIPGISNNRVDYGGLSSISQAQQPSGQTFGDGTSVGGPGGPLSANGQPSEETPYEQPTGLFGIKGTMRDILGSLGDALLIGQGGKAIYSPQRKQEKMAEAMHGYEQDPQAAIARLAQLNPDEARKLQDSLSKKATRKAELSFSQDDNTRRNEDHKLTRYNKAMGVGAKLLGGANKENYSAMKQLYEQFFTNRGMDVPFQLGDEYSEEGLEQAVRTLGMDAKSRERLEFDEGKQDNLEAYRQGTLEDKARGRDIQSRNSDSQDTRRTNQSANDSERTEISRDKPKRLIKGNTRSRVTNGVTQTQVWSGTKWKDVN